MARERCAQPDRDHPLSRPTQARVAGFAVTVRELLVSVDDCDAAAGADSLEARLRPFTTRGCSVGRFDGKVAIVTGRTHRPSHALLLAPEGRRLS
jgi:hypothetical protein